MRLLPPSCLVPHVHPHTQTARLGPGTQDGRAQSHTGRSRFYCSCAPTSSSDPSLGCSPHCPASVRPEIPGKRSCLLPQANAPAQSRRGAQEETWNHPHPNMDIKFYHCLEGSLGGSTPLAWPGLAVLTHSTSAVGM